MSFKQTIHRKSISLAHSPVYNLTGDLTSDGKGKILYPLQNGQKKGNLNVYKCHITLWIETRHYSVGNKDLIGETDSSKFHAYCMPLKKESKIFSKRSHVDCVHLSYVTLKWFTLVKSFV